MVAKPEDPIILVGQEGKEIQSVERLLRIGFWNIKGYNKFKIEDYPGEKIQPKIIDGKEALTIENRTHLDVRNLPEWKETGVFENSILIPLGELSNRTEETKGKTNLMVSCRSGLRARFAYSILAKAGIDSIVLSDMVTNFKDQGHNMVEYKA